MAVARTGAEVSEYLKADDDDAGGWLPLLSKITDKILFIRIYQHTAHTHYTIVQCSHVIVIIFCCCQFSSYEINTIMCRIKERVLKDFSK